MQIRFFNSPAPSKPISDKCRQKMLLLTAMPLWLILLQDTFKTTVATHQRVILEKQVLWLQVTMCNIQGVTMFQGLADLHKDIGMRHNLVFCVCKSTQYTY